MTEQPTTTAPTRVMALYAHPDDPEFFSGGTLIKWADEGKEIIYVLATSGDKGSDDPEMTSDRLVQIRQTEQRAAARHAKSDNVIFLGFRDGELVPDLGLRRALTRVIRQQKPDIIVTNDPTTRWNTAGSINHPDHRAIGDATLDAVFPAARDRLNFIELWRDESLDPHKVKQVYLAGTLSPNAKVDISGVLDRKIAAICEHKSQVKDVDGLIKRLRDNPDSELRGDRPAYTESFRVLTLR